MEFVGIVGTRYRELDRRVVTLDGNVKSNLIFSHEKYSKRIRIRICNFR